MSNLKIDRLLAVVSIMTYRAGGTIEVENPSEYEGLPMYLEMEYFPEEDKIELRVEVVTDDGPGKSIH